MQCISNINNTKLLVSVADSENIDLIFLFFAFCSIQKYENHRIQTIEAYNTLCAQLCVK